MALNPGFWRGRRVLVTGHSGFKGGWLCWWLHALGARVAGIALDPPSEPCLAGVTGLEREIRAERCDVRDAGALHAAVARHQPEVVFHLAAQSLVRRSYAAPVDTFATNVAGTVNCLQAVLECASVRAAIMVTSDKCYRDDGQGRAFVESDPLGGHDPYAASKACAEIVTASYRDALFLPRGAALVASARAGNVLGGGDWAEDRLVPDALAAFAAGKPLVLRNPRATRPWQHVLEALHGYLILGERLHGGERGAAAAWNFGPDRVDVRPVSWIADELARRWGAGAGWRQAEGAHVHETMDLGLDSRHARTHLGWRPQLGLAQALDWIVEWHRAYLAGSAGDGATRGARAATLAQIDRYQSLCLA